MNSSSESSKARKRRREAEIEDDGDGNGNGNSEIDSLEDCLTFSDTLVALRMMRVQFPNIDKVSVQPFILQSQLYSTLKDRTEVDRELECLKREKVVRVFKLNTGQDDHAIMFLDDYLKQIDHVISRFEERMQLGTGIFQWFKTHVLDCKLEPSIGHQELCTLLSLGGKVKDEDISLLINAGLLGRKELISLLKRTKYKEMMMTSLQKKRLRFSSLDMRFHIRDLIGSGYLRTVQSPTGLLVQLSKD
ncbi:serine/threonine-protein kinase 19 homolog isoform X2 [Cucurbita moschata]|uniref:Serine/threonine-protein kinase 19 homolog isoform X2 n=1 Tax=Cucurbita moschata TaxID=3662 RepID=A0A6J1GQ52_CUCMO|nr:serine/threonine-protein kinase 19 homolog isoform X2 [Cucurbita moschata]